MGDQNGPELGADDPKTLELRDRYEAQAVTLDKISREAGGSPLVRAAVEYFIDRTFR